MISQLDSENADRNLTSQIAVLTHTPSATVPMQCQGLILLGDGTKNLDGTGGDYEYTITVGGQTIQPDPQVVTHSTAARCAVWTKPFPVPANAEVVLKVKSPNAGDSDVDVTAYLYAVSVADVRSWNAVPLDTTNPLPNAAPGSGSGLPTAAAVAATDAKIGTPVALDGGTATVAGMLTKLADDADGADYDAGMDSLHEQRQPSRTSVSVNVAQLRDRLDNGARVVFCDRSFFNDTGRSMRWGFLRTLKRPNAGLGFSGVGGGGGVYKEAFYATGFASTNCAAPVARDPNAACGLTDLTNGFMNRPRLEWVWTGNGEADKHVWIGWLKPAESGLNGCEGWQDITWMSRPDLLVRVFYVRSAYGITLNVYGYGAATVSPSPTVLDTSTGNNAVGQLCWVDIPITVANHLDGFGLNFKTRSGAVPTAGKGFVFCGVQFVSPTQSAYGVETDTMAWGGSSVDHALDPANMSDANMALYARANRIDTVVIWYMDAVAPTYLAAGKVALAQRWETAINAARAIDPTIREPLVCFVANPENVNITSNATAEALKAAAEENGYSCVDLYTLVDRKHGNVSEWGTTYYSDGIHPNDVGREEFAGLIVDEIFESAEITTLDEAVAALPTAAENADAVWDEATAGHTAAGSFGKLVGTTWAALFSGITSLANWLRALARSSTPDATALSEINTGGGTYAVSTDSLEAGGTTRASIASSAGNIVAGQVINLVSGIARGGRMEIRAGDSYLSSDSTHLRVPVTTLPDLTGATVAWTFKPRSGGAAITATGGAANAGEATQYLTLERTPAQSALFTERGRDVYTAFITVTWSTPDREKTVELPVDVFADET